jgi:hypothetical protein
MQFEPGPEEVIIPLVAITGAFGLPMVWVVAHYAYSAWKQWQATSLVRDLIARGYTAAEIIQICQVLGHKKASLPKSLPDVPPAKQIKQPAYSS